MHESESAGALLEVRNNFQKHKMQYNYYYKKKLGAFRSELKKVKKNGFPIVFPKWIWLRQRQVPKLNLVSRKEISVKLCLGWVGLGLKNHSLLHTQVAYFSKVE